MYPEVKRIELAFVRSTIRLHIADVYDAMYAVGVRINISGENKTTISTPLQMTKTVFLTRVLNICSQCDLCCLVGTRFDASCFLLCTRRVFSLASHWQDRFTLLQESLIAPTATSDEPKSKECLCRIHEDPMRPRGRPIVDNGAEWLEKNLCSGLDDRMSIMVTRITQLMEKEEEGRMSRRKGISTSRSAVSELRTDLRTKQLLIGRSNKQTADSRHNKASS